MRAGLLLRIGLLAIGVSAIYTALTSGAYYMYLHLKAGGAADSFGNSHAAGAICYFLTPLSFAFICFAFASRIERLLLGDAATERVEIAGHPELFASVGIKLIGLYFLATHLGPMLATIYELLGVKSENPQVSGVQTNSDLIMNGVGLLLAYFLCVKTRWFTKVLQDE